MRTTCFALVAAAAALLFVTPLAEAQSAEILIQQGLDLRRQQRDEEALDRFNQAYAMNRSAQAMAQIALAEQALGRYVLAEAHLQQALAVQGDVWIDTRRPQLTQALQQIAGQLGTIEIQGGVAGGQVFVNGEDRGTLPQAARLRARAGTAVVEIRAQGYVAVQRSVQVTAGGTAREAIQMIAASGQVQVQGGGGQVQGGGPVYTTYNGGVRPQQQVTYETQPNMGLFWAGLPMFAAPWLLTGLITYAVDGGLSDATTYGFLPLIGPFLLLDYAYEDYEVTILVLDGIVQIAGVTLMILGLTTTRQVATRAQLGDGPRAPTLTFTPMVSPEFAGGALTLTHF